MTASWTDNTTSGNDGFMSDNTSGNTETGYHILTWSLTSNTLARYGMSNCARCTRAFLPRRVRDARCPDCQYRGCTEF